MMHTYTNRIFVVYPKFRFLLGIFICSVWQLYSFLSPGRRRGPEALRQAAHGSPAPAAPPNSVPHQPLWASSQASKQRAMTRQCQGAIGHRTALRSVLFLFGWYLDAFIAIWFISSICLSLGFHHTDSIAVASE